MTSIGFGPSLVQLQRARGGRQDWADIAKAISIILLVFWTTVGDRYYLNEMLILLRMPLFFFVSGLFAYRIIAEADLGTLLRERVGKLLYLYALWVGLLFLTTDLVGHLLFGWRIDPWRQLALFWNPLFTMWFLYALAVAVAIAWAVRRLPVSVVIAVAVIAYCISVASGEWRHLPFLERVVRLFPFFWIGLVAMPLAAVAVERLHRFWPVVLGAFLAFSYALFDSPLNHVGPLTFATTLVGIAAILLVSRALAPLPLARPLTVIGASTLYIYVMQRIVLWYLDRGVDAIGVHIPGIDAAKAIVIVAICTVVGGVLARAPRTAWLFEAPWLLGDRRRAWRERSAIAAPRP